ncbi:MAG: hypothetical protein ACKV2Q_08585 [Planctomycetaceae bacterium]
MEQFEQRICQRDYSTADLQAWLQGLSLPLDGDRYEPFERLLTAVQTCDDRFSASKATEALIGRLHDVLAIQLDATASVPLPETLLYNSLLLSARLACPHQLGALVHRIYERRQVHQIPEFRPLLRHALFNALIENQIDGRLENLWGEVIESGRGEGYFEARPQDGWDGLVRMVQTKEPNWETVVEKLGPKLKTLASQEPNPKFRREYLDHLVTPLLSLAKPKVPQSNWPMKKRRMIVELADKGNWPKGMVLSLDLSASWTENDNYFFMVWTPLFQGIPENVIQRDYTKTFCNQAVTEFAICQSSSDPQTWIEPIGQTSQEFEKLRQYEILRQDDNVELSDKITRIIIREGLQFATETAKEFNLKDWEKYLLDYRRPTVKADIPPITRTTQTAG